MSKKSGGLFAFLTGMAVGAAALFLSDEGNRKKTKKAVEETTATAKKEAKILQAKALQVKKNAIAKAKKVKTAAKKAKEAAKKG